MKRYQRETKRKIRKFIKNRLPVTSKGCDGIHVAKMSNYHFGTRYFYVTCSQPIMETVPKWLRFYIYYTQKGIKHKFTLKRKGKLYV